MPNRRGGRSSRQRSARRVGRNPGRVAGTSTAGTLGATDIENDALTFSIVTYGSQGTAAITNASTGVYSYTAGAAASGTDTFTFKANDAADDPNIATVIVTISSTNQPPIAINSAVSTDVCANTHCPTTCATLMSWQERNGPSLFPPRWLKPSSMRRRKTGQRLVPGLPPPRHIGCASKLVGAASPNGKRSTERSPRKNSPPGWLELAHSLVAPKAGGRHGIQHRWQASPTTRGRWSPANETTGACGHAANASYRLYQLHDDGWIWRYTGTPCNGNSCPGWQLLDNKLKTVSIMAGGGALYQLHDDGWIWRYTGTPCSGNSCPGWQRLDNNPATETIAAGSQLYQLH